MSGQSAKQLTSRRKFLVRLGGAGLSTAAAATPLRGGSAQESERATRWDSAFDWVCVGAGEAGPAAAIFGHDLGFETLLIERSAMVGGTTSQSAGILYVPMNHLMKEANIPDSREEALRYFRYMGAGYNAEDHVEAFLDHAPRAVEYLDQKAEVHFRISEVIDFWAGFSEGGWRLNEAIEVGSKRVGRSLMCEPLSAQTLGRWRDTVRLSLHYHGLAEALEGQQHNPALGRRTRGASLGPSIGHSGPVRGADSLALRLWRRALGSRLDPMLKRDEEERVAGAALAAALWRAVIRRGIEVQTETSCERVLVDRGRVVGVAVNRRGKVFRIGARRGVVLATGSGSGWRLATGAEGAVHSKIRIQGLGTITVPGEHDPDGSPRSRSNYELRMRHSLVVNRFGERFGDEGPYQALGSKLLHFDSHGEHRFIHLPHYFIFDQQLIEKYSFAGRPPGATEGLDWVSRGSTLAELAEKLSLPADRLEATVARFNEHARRGSDPDFQRRPETLGPLEKPPFYGVRASAPDHDPLQASISVVTDPRGRVLHYRSQQPIPGLYCCGALQEDQFLVGVGYHAGMHLAMGVTFALLAAEHAASV